MMIGQNLQLGLALSVLWLLPGVPLRADEAAPSTRPGVREILPDASETWGRPENVETFGPENLFELVDGEAESYLAYGFEEVAACRYTLKEHNEAADVRVYRMADPLQSFGIFSIQRGPTVTPVRIGTEGFEVASNVYFFQGPYFVQVEGPPGSARTIAAVRDLASAIASRLPASRNLPIELSYLPRESMQPLSLVYVTNGVLGQQFLRNGLVANFTLGGEIVGAFITFWNDACGAKEAFASFAEYARTRGSGFEEMHGLAEQAFQANDAYLKSIVVARKGRFVLGVTRAEGTERARELALRLTAHLEEVEKAKPPGT